MLLLDPPETCDWCGEQPAVIYNAFREPLCRACASRCCSDCSRGLDNDPAEHDGCAMEGLLPEEEPSV